jgi:hypothetical protein
MTGRGARRCKQLLDDVKETREIGRGRTRSRSVAKSLWKRQERPYEFVTEETVRIHNRLCLSVTFLGIFLKFHTHFLHWYTEIQLVE